MTQFGIMMIIQIPWRFFSHACSPEHTAASPIPDGHRSTFTDATLHGVCLLSEQRTVMAIHQWIMARTKHRPCHHERLPYDVGKTISDKKACMSRGTSRSFGNIAALMSGTV